MPTFTRDGPWLAAKIAAGDLRMLMQDDGTGGFVDVELLAGDGRRYLGTVGTLADVVATMTRWQSTGECLSGTYFWVSDLVLLDDLEPDSIARVVNDLAATGELGRAFSLADG